MDKKGTSDDFTDQEMIDWLRQEEDLRVCLSHDIRTCRVKPSPRELLAAEYMERLLARIAALEAALKPFAYDYGDYSDGMWSDLDYIQVSVGDLRAARAAMEGKDG